MYLAYVLLAIVAEYHLDTLNSFILALGHHDSQVRKAPSTSQYNDTVRHSARSTPDLEVPSNSHARASA